MMVYHPVYIPRLHTWLLHTTVSLSFLSTKLPQVMVYNYLRTLESIDHSGSDSPGRLGELGEDLEWISVAKSYSKP